MQHENIFIGVDVAKAELVVALPGLKPKAVANTPQDIQQWLQNLPPGASIAMESTGRYHGQLANLARQAGFKVYVLNARDVFFHARSLGVRGKTDRLDCEVIADYMEKHHDELREWAGNDTVYSELTELLNCRATIAKHKAAMRQALKGIKGLQAPATLVQQQLEQFLQQIDAQVDRLIASDAQLAQGCARLRTIKGIGPQGAALLGALFSRFEFANSDALVAFAGLDPRPNDSGAKRGRRRLTKRGPALLRRQMWLAGFAATRSTALKPLYASLRARGLATTEAIVVLARKLLRVAFAVWRGTESFDAKRIGPAIA